ncbi:MAG: hypothetical protein H6621_08930 [Halobacteriovoraceae bacterium]|nr:hypothetical protein [Halobacteriovoraceae bacterium]MCB9095177.1 hypothetical protein [Halobacteriovoraceae bacterium]
MSDEKKNLSDLLKKAVSTGIGAAFMTEDMIRSAWSDIANKDSLNSLIQNAKNSRDEFLGSIKSEIKSYLSHIDLEKEIDRILENYDIEVNANVSFKKKNSGKKKSSDKKSSDA